MTLKFKSKTAGENSVSACLEVRILPYTWKHKKKWLQQIYWCVTRSHTQAHTHTHTHEYTHKRKRKRHNGDDNNKQKRGTLNEASTIQRKRRFKKKKNLSGKSNCAHE